MTIVSVILTFDSPDTLQECVRRNLAQTRPPDEILVVDNAGSASAAATLERADLAPGTLRVLRTEENLGPAGGYATGLAWFRDSPHGVAWVMDDDCWPEPGALAALEARLSIEPRPSLVFPEEVDGLDGSSLNNPSWSGVLIPKPVVEQVGLPRADFFWWMEDTEYLRLRMRAAQIPVVREHAALVIQSRARRTGDRPAWKTYYEVRNSTYVRFHLKGRAALLQWAGRMGRRLAATVLKEGDRVTKLRAFARGLHDGYRGRLGKRYPVS